MLKKIFEALFKKKDDNKLSKRPTEKLYDRILLSMDLESINKEMLECFRYIECHDIKVHEVLMNHRTLKLLRVLFGDDCLNFYNPQRDNEDGTILWGAKLYRCDKLKFGQILFLPGMSDCNGLSYELIGGYCTVSENVKDNLKLLENGAFESEYIDPSKFSDKIKEKSIENYMKMTKKELLQLARDLEIAGRSKMNKRELAESCWQKGN